MNYETFLEKIKETTFSTEELEAKVTFWVAKDRREFSKDASEEELHRIIQETKIDAAEFFIWEKERENEIDIKALPDGHHNDAVISALNNAGDTVTEYGFDHDTLEARFVVANMMTKADVEWVALMLEEDEVAS